jgi:hypothetical protein
MLIGRLPNRHEEMAIPSCGTLTSGPPDCAIIEFILDLLRKDFPFHEVDLGSGETGYVMNNANGKGLYIKVKIASDAKEEVWVLSFHISQHSRS